MSLKILADTSVVYNGDELLYQYISSVKLINAEQGFTDNTKIEITLITSRKQNELTDGSIYNEIVDWLTQKQKPKEPLNNFVAINTMDYTLEEIEHPLDNPYQMIVKNNELHLTYKQIVPPRKLIETPLPQTGITLHYGNLTFFADIQPNQVTITPPKGMSCKDLTGQNNCSFSNSNKPKKLKILGPSPKPPTPKPPTPNPPNPPKPNPPKPSSTQINVDPNIYSINDLDTQIDFQGYPKEGKYFYIIDFDGDSVDVLVATKKQLQNSFPILQQINLYKQMIEQGQEHNNQTLIDQNIQLLQDYIREESVFPVSIQTQPSKNGNISLAKKPKGFIDDVKLNDIIVYNNNNPELMSPDFKQPLQLMQKGNDFVIQAQNPFTISKSDEKSSGMSKNELYAIIFGSIGGVLLIGLILYFDLRSGKKSKKKQKRH